MDDLTEARLRQTLDRANHERITARFLALRDELAPLGANGGLTQNERLAVLVWQVAGVSRNNFKGMTIAEKVRYLELVFDNAYEELPTFKSEEYKLRVLKDGDGNPVLVFDDPKICGNNGEYVLVSELWPSRTEFKRASDVTKFLKKLPNEPAPTGIRNIRNGQRRLVHESDWHRFFREKDRRESELLDHESLQEIIAQIEAQKTVEHELKKVQ